MVAFYWSATNADVYDIRPTSSTLGWLVVCSSHFLEVWWLVEIYLHLLEDGTMPPPPPLPLPPLGRWWGGRGLKWYCSQWSPPDIAHEDNEQGVTEGDRGGSGDLWGTTIYTSYNSNSSSKPCPRDWSSFSFTCSYSIHLVLPLRPVQIKDNTSNFKKIRFPYPFKLWSPSFLSGSTSTTSKYKIILKQMS